MTKKTTIIIGLLLSVLTGLLSLNLYLSPKNPIATAPKKISREACEVICPAEMECWEEKILGFICVTPPGKPCLAKDENGECLENTSSLVREYYGIKDCTLYSDGDDLVENCGGEIFRYTPVVE